MDRHELIAQLEDIVGKNGVMSAPAELAVYGYDGSIERHTPDVVVLPTSTAQVAAIMQLAARNGVPVVPRGAGTGVSGGSVPIAGGIVLGTARMKRIVEVNVEDRYAVVEPGVINLDVSAAAAPFGLSYVPDPSSQTVSTIGGNVAENAGGPHCLLYGMTSNHVLGMELVLPNGDVVNVGGVAPDATGYDLRGALVGAEGTLAVVTKIIVRLIPRPTDARTLLAMFSRLEDAGSAVSAIIAQGIIPAALEIMDGLMMRAVEAAVHAGYPPDAEAVLLVEVDGYAEGLDDMTAEIEQICRDNGAGQIRLAATADERAALWRGRKSAFGAMGRIAPSYYIQDGVVPRSRLPEVLRYVVEVGRKHGIKIANVLHAGDGNLHPLVAFDPRTPGVLQTVRAASADILRKCVELGGAITGEHGVGLEKQDFMGWYYSEDDMAQMRRLKIVFDPEGLLNPGKMFPGARSIESPQR
jgi:glycolate oxidase